MTIMYDRVHNIYTSKMYENKGTNGREKWKHAVIRFSYYKWNSINHFEVDCDILKIFNIDPKATIKITKQRAIAYKPTKEIKWSRNNTQFIQKKAEKEEKREHRTDGSWIPLKKKKKYFF